jgi:phage baseplate assembly protein W
MPSYVGFSTINANKPRTISRNTGVDGGNGSVLQPIVFGKKFASVDSPLVIQDFVNALNIRQGEKVGQPGYGTSLWSFVFEPNTADVQFQLENEIRRVASQDPRMILNSVKAYPQENGILLEVELAVTPFNQATLLSVFFNSATNVAVLQ